MAPPASRALEPALGPGSVLAGRYRLHTRLTPVPGDPAQAERWRAEDVVLARAVDVLVVVASGRRAGWGRELLEAAAAAGTVSEPALARVYDAAVEQVDAERYGRPAGRVDVAYVVTEHLAGATVAEVLLESGPLRPDDAVDLVLGAVDGLAAAHARGVVHGGITPAVAVVTDTGLRLRDAAVAAVLARRAEPATSTPTVADDVRALAGCLYALLTGRWPGACGPHSGGLPEAPRVGSRQERLCSPRQLRAGVPSALDAAIMRVLGVQPGDERAIETAPAFGRLLRDAMAADTAARLPVRRPRRSSQLPPAVSRRLPAALVLVVALAVGLTAYSQGRGLGTVTRDRSDLQALVEATPSASPGSSSGAGTRLNLSPPGVRVTAFDPPPGDGRENDAAVSNVLDGDPATAWTTENYDSAQLGGVKGGVGLLVDLGQPTAVAQVELGVGPGLDLELHAGDTAPAAIDSLPTVATVSNAPAVTRLTPPQPVTARYFVVWLTRLPPDRGRFRGTVSEMFFVRG